MQLVPAGPPGRSTRKARAYVSEIHRLRDEGYTLDAIRDALDAAGVHVSISTVRREAIRPRNPAASAINAADCVAVKTGTDPSRPGHIGGHNHHGASASQPSPRSFVNDSRTGKQIVEEFMKGRTTNPLLQERT